MEIQTQKIYLFVKLDPKQHKGPKVISRDVTNIGHYGTGDLEITITDLQDLEASKDTLKLAYETIGA
jgi:predicted transport protein